jgi:acyl-CoA dehydrogenase
VILDDCRPPDRLLLGGKDGLDERLALAREGASSSQQAAMATFELSRPALGAQAIGIACAAYEYARDYANERVQLGPPIIENQAIAFALTEMAVAIESARLFVWRAGGKAVQLPPFTIGEGSMAKLAVSKAAVSVTSKTARILGGYGSTQDYPVERWHRDAMIDTIFEGTSEIQCLIIARSLSGLKLR